MLEIEQVGHLAGRVPGEVILGEDAADQRNDGGRVGRASRLDHNRMRMPRRPSSDPGPVGVKRRMIILTSRRIRALARSFDRDERGSPWTRGEKRLKTRLAAAALAAPSTSRSASSAGSASGRSQRIRPDHDAEAGDSREWTGPPSRAQSDAARPGYSSGSEGASGWPWLPSSLHFGHPGGIRHLRRARPDGAPTDAACAKRSPPPDRGMGGVVAVFAGIGARRRMSLRILGEALWHLGAERAPDPGEAAEGVATWRCCGKCERGRTP